MRIMRRPRALVAVVAGCVLLAGCGGPSQVGAAAIVGGNTASLDDVQAKLNTLVQTDTYAKTQAQQHKLDDLTRAIVSREILYRLVDDAAKREQLPFDEKNVSAFLPSPAQQQGTDDPGAAIDASVDKAFDPQDVARHNLLIAELGLKHIGSVNLVADTVQLTDPSQALALANRIAADPSKSAQLIQQAGAPAGAVALNAQVSSTTSSSIQWYSKPGSVIYQVIPAAQSQSGTASYVVVVVKKTTVSTGTPNPDPSTLTPQQLLLYGRFLLRPSEDALGIKVNPRYGEWNSFSMSVGSAAENATVGEIIAPQSAAS
jgi:TolA-binding protein